MSDTPDFGKLIKDIADQRIRTAADRWSLSYENAKRLTREWQLRKYGDLIPDDPDYIVPDGSPEDGRQPITGRCCHDIVRVCYVIINFCETPNPDFGGRTPLEAITNAAVNGAFPF